MPRRALTTTRRRFAVRTSNIHGKGLFASIPYEAGDYVGSYKGEWTQDDGPHVLWIHEEEGSYGIDGRNELRFVNHSDEPNAIFWGNDLYALRAIRVGEEITFDYGKEWADPD
jgi:hypothetical protein